MANVIIGIHGLKNKPKPEITSAWWKLSILDGIKMFYRGEKTELNFELVYWSDILYENPLDETISDPKHELFVNEPYLTGYKAHDAIHTNGGSTFRDKILGKLDSLFLNVNYSLNYSSLSGLLLEKSFADLDAYYKNLPNRDGILSGDAIRNRLKMMLMKYQNDRIMLIAHSMGSIIAYDVLSEKDTPVKVDTLLTVGSPLGFPLVKGKIAHNLGLIDRLTQKPPTPESITTQWLNIADFNDKVAFHYHLCDDFAPNSKGLNVKDIMVRNNYRFRGEKNPHKIYGYLKTYEIASKIFNFIRVDEAIAKPSLFKKLKTQVRNFMIKLQGHDKK